MTNTDIPVEPAQQLAESLFNFAIERDDLKQMLARLPESETINPVAVEYEIQLLKILSVGWGIAFIIEDPAAKEQVGQVFWGNIQGFSDAISQMSNSATGKDINYFNILRERVGIYVNALRHFPDVEDPALVIGPTFAKLCGSEEEMEVISSGRVVFNSSLGFVRKQVDAGQVH